MNYKKYYFKNWDKLHHVSYISSLNLIVLEVEDSYEIMLLNDYTLSGEQEFTSNHILEGKIVTTLLSQKYSNTNITIESLRPDLDNIKDVRIKLDNKDGYVFIERN